MCPSKRLRINVGERTYQQLVHLADLADQSVAVEARLLLTWGIDLALRRWEELCAGDGDDQPDQPHPAGWSQPTLPMVDLSEEETTRALDELRQNPRLVLVSTDEQEPPRPFAPID